MRAEDRHRLKTNELAQKLSELPEYLGKHSKTISIVLATAVVVCVVGYFWRSAQNKAYLRQNEAFQELFPQIAQAQNNAATAAQDPKAQSETNSYTIDAILGTLANVSAKTQGTPLGMMALLQQADLKRSELYYSNRLLSDEERENICRTAESLYNQILSQYPNYPQALGTAKLGLALVAEDRGDWEKAKAVYEDILAETDGKLAGTSFPLLAQKQLRRIDEIAISIEFPDIEPEPEEQKEPAQTAADKILFGGDNKIKPIKIEIPPAPVPRKEKEDTPIGPAPEDAKTKNDAESSEASAPQPDKTTETDEKKEN